jgi:hypothetical protein
MSKPSARREWKLCKDGRLRYLPAEFTDQERKDSFLSKVAIEANGCWLWQGARHGNGYGGFKIRGRQYGAHQAAWILFKGEIPEGKLVCHHCDTPLCVNPNHLFIGTPLDNVRDMFAKGRANKAKGSGCACILSEDMVIEMRKLHKSTGQSIASIARLYGVKAGTVQAAIRRVNWRHC